MIQGPDQGILIEVAGISPGSEHLPAQIHRVASGIDCCLQRFPGSSRRQDLRGCRDPGLLRLRKSLREHGLRPRIYHESAREEGGPPYIHSYCAVDVLEELPEPEAPEP